MYLVADGSAVTAHYRLGVGVNLAFANVGDLSDLLRALAAAPTTAAAAATTAASRAVLAEQAAGVYDQRVAARVRRVVQFQLFAIYFETRCGLIVIKDKLFRRRHKQGDLVEVGVAQAFDECEKQLQKSEEGAE